MKRRNLIFGGIILEIAIALSVVIPAYVVVTMIAGYLEAISSVKTISAEAARRFDLKLLRKNIGIEGAEISVDPSVIAVPGSFTSYATTMGRLLDSLPKPHGSTLSINYMVKYINVDKVSGAPNSAELNVESTNSYSSDPAVPHFAFGGSGNLNTTFLERALDGIQQHTSIPFPWAIPSGVREIHQVSYLGASSTYSQNTPNENDIRTANFLRYAPIVGISVVLDISNTRTGRFIRNLPQFINIFSNHNSRGTSLTFRDNVTLIHDTQLIFPRSPL